MRTVFLRAIWVWVIFYVLAVLNSLLRDTFYIPELGNIGGRIAGTLVLLVVMLAVMYGFLRRNAAHLTRVRLVAIGVLWLGLSLFFEFAVSHWVMEEDWELILSRYNVMSGRFHVLVRLLELAGPILLGSRVLPAAEPPESIHAGAPPPTGEGV